MNILHKIISIFKKRKEYDDFTLRKYKSEKDSEYNDGWTKSHYKDLYNKRLIELKNVKRRIS